MSHVLSIRRAEAPYLTRQEILRFVATDDSLSFKEPGPVFWVDPETRQKHCVNVDSDHLWTDDTDDTAFLDKLRNTAHSLHAEVLAETGENLASEAQKGTHSPDPVPRNRSI